MEFVLYELPIYLSRKRLDVSDGYLKYWWAIKVRKKINWTERERDLIVKACLKCHLNPPKVKRIGKSEKIWEVKHHDEEKMKVIFK